MLWWKRCDKYKWALQTLVVWKQDFATTTPLSKNNNPRNYVPKPKPEDYIDEEMIKNEIIHIPAYELQPMDSPVKSQPVYQRNREAWSDSDESLDVDGDVS